MSRAESTPTGALSARARLTPMLAPSELAARFEVVTSRESRQRTRAHDRAADGDITRNMWMVGEDRMVGGSNLLRCRRGGVHGGVF